MHKVNKHYRLGYHTCDKLDILKNLMVGKTETAIVEEAICKFADTVIIDEGEHIKVVNENVRKIRINRGY